MVQEGSMVVTRTLADQLRVTVNPEVEVHPQVHSTPATAAAAAVY
jgi:hypothetical protein